MKEKSAHLICHTHWDREWYLTREEFRIRLVRLVDRLLDLFATAPEDLTFMLDGQTIALEDYLSIRPEREEELRRIIKTGRLVIGPWYVLPDELLVSGESHIRNYMAGDAVAARFGKKMNVGYLPDSFGHPEQMPQILRGLGMDTMVFWRGASAGMEKTEFLLESAYRKSRVLCVNLPCGYGNSACLTGTPEEIAERLCRMQDTLRGQSFSQTVVLMNGSDHIAAQQDITEIVASYNKRFGAESPILFSTLEQFLNELKPTLPELPVFRGELCYGDKSMLLGGTLSTRMYLKQQNFQAQSRMERYLEPLAALSVLLGKPDPLAGYGSRLWKMILENHPHDSICGCSVDAVHREMEGRFACVGQLQETLMGDITDSLMASKTLSEPYGDAFVFWFEPTQDGLPCYGEATVDFDSMLLRKVNYAKSTIDEFGDTMEHPDAPVGVGCFDESGREISCRILTCEKAEIMRLSDDTTPEVYRVNRLKIALRLPCVSYGAHTLSFVKREAEALPENSGDKGDFIENEFYRVTYDEEKGGFTVLEKRTGKVHTGVCALFDGGDAGDEYTYSPPREDRAYGRPDLIKLTVSKEAGIAEELKAEGVLTLPKSLSKDRSSRSGALIENPFTLKVQAVPGIDWLDFSFEIDNRALDHRLQAFFPSGARAEFSEASMAFAVTERKVRLEIPDNWMEYPRSTHPTHGFVDVGSDVHGLTLASRGLTEYEAVDGEKETFLRLTLLRCVGWLSRADLLTRKGNGGWELPTPEAQCLGKHSCHFGICYRQGGWRESGSFAQTDRALHPPFFRQTPTDGGAYPVLSNPLTFVQGLPGNLRLSALKPCEDGSGLVLRFYSILKNSEECSFALPANVLGVYRAMLHEERAERLPISDHIVRLLVEPGEICTLVLEICRE